MATTITSAIETITPDLALEILGDNENNRNVRPRVVGNYSRDMKAGNWALNGESIKIDINGSLIDGQHRLNAVIVADVPVQMMVVRGLPPEAKATVDSGAVRLNADLLAINGEKHVTTLSATMRRLWLREQGIHLTHASVSPTKSELADFLTAHPEVRRAVNASVALGLGIGFPASATASAMYLTEKVNAEKSEWFFNRVADEDVPVGHPARLLRKKIIDHRLSGKRMSTDESLGYMVRAWNMYRSGRSGKWLVLVNSGNLNNENFPIPQ